MRGTVIKRGSGYSVVLDLGKAPDGKAIARDSGQVRVELLVDDGGTPNDPFDDEVLEESLVKVTGRTDDSCAAVVPVLVG